MTGEHLTLKQQNFIREYLVDHNGKQAAIRAGYSPRSAEVTASKLLRLGKVKQVVEVEVQRLVEHVREEIQVDVEWVVRGLKENAEKSSQAAPVRDREGNETGVYSYQPNAVNRSLELIGKHLGMFQERPQSSPEPEQRETPAELGAHQSHQAAIFLRELKREEGIETIDEAVRWLEVKAERGAEA